MRCVEHDVGCRIEVSQGEEADSSVVVKGLVRVVLTRNESWLKRVVTFDWHLASTGSNFHRNAKSAAGEDPGYGHPSTISRSSITKSHGLVTVDWPISHLKFLNHLRGSFLRHISSMQQRLLSTSILYSTPNWIQPSTLTRSSTRKNLLRAKSRCWKDV